MARSIHKFKLGSETTILMPDDAEFLQTREQGDDLCMWVLADWAARSRVRTFELFGTGHEIPANGIYIGTGHLPRVGLVMHVFEVVA